MDAKSLPSGMIAKVSSRQLAFVREYFKDRNATQAAIRAGYTPKAAPLAGHRLTKNDKIARIIRQQEFQLMREAEIDEAWVIENLKNNAIRGIELDDLSSVNRSLELIGKHIGMFVDRSSLNVTFDQIDSIEVRIIDPPTIDSTDYSIDEKRRDK